MLRRLRFIVLGFAICAVGGMLCRHAPAETILKLGLGSDAPPDVEFDETTLSTVDDGNGGTTGDQNTNVDYQGFLSGMADIISPPGSFTIDGLMATGDALVLFETVVIQAFLGGDLELYDADNILLLSGMLDASLLSGVLGGPATGAVFTTTFGTVTGGTLAPLIDPDSLTLSMSLTSINAGLGLSVTDGEFPQLESFTADVTLNIAAQPIPEPGTATLLFSGAALTGFWAVWRKRAPLAR
ncbi:MAG: hypothetical protein WD063_01150 [Pirellulales bacterium]